MSLRARLFGAILVTLCIVLGLLVLVTLLAERERNEELDDLRRSSLRFAGEVAMRLQPESVQDSALVGRDRVVSSDLTAISVFRRRKGDAPTSDHFGAAELDQEVAARAKELADEVFRTGESYGRGFALAVPMRGESAASDVPEAVAVLEVEPGAGGPERVTRLAFLVVVGALLVLLAVTWFIVDRVVARPLAEVVRGAERVAVGDYGTPVAPTEAADEIRQVVAAFNSMMVEIGTLQGRMRERTQDALLTARKTQDSLVIAQRLASTGRLAAGIAHEVNNPLAGMLNAVHALRTKELPPAKRDEYLEIVEDGLHRVQATVAKILQFTPHKVAPRPVAIDEVVRPVLALSRHRVEREEVEVVTVPAGEGAVVFGDPYELQQALLNVVLNALDALEEAHRETPRIEIRTSVGDDEVQLVVSDNGTGMKDEDVPRAFDLFFTTKEPGKGTGLGLATAHKILMDHGGRVELRPRGTEGMDVAFVLPRFRG
jgi:two-component system NtrC family sensor kinase